MNGQHLPPRTARIAWITIVLLLATLALALWLRVAAAGSARTKMTGAPLAFVSGSVSGAGGPLAGARVRVRATDNLTFSNQLGQFTLTGLTPGEPIQVTAWYSGYYIAGASVTPTVSGLTLTLRPLPTVDHPAYAWTSPITGTSPKACSNCHPMIMSQWQQNAHGRAVANPRFYSLYDGTNLSGTAVVTPGYRLDFPGTAGNCANCHAPAAAVDGYLTTAMDDVRNVITAGIHCDFCHKVGGAYLDPGSGTVYPNTPGVQSLGLLRPPAGDDIFFGPFDDVPDPDTYLALLDQSQYCAACHQFSFWGTPIYESYNEWLASPYAGAGVTCQSCHMAPNGDSYFALPGVGGLPHPPQTIPSHLQPGAAAVALLQRTVSMTVSAQQVGGQLLVTVAITNTGAGHHVPTDHPGRHLILDVTATGADGEALPQLAGPTVPAWGGAQAGLPGLLFAKLLQDAATGQMPVVSYWKQSLIAADNRIPALACDISTYRFALPPAGESLAVTARLTFRRLYQPLADARGWSEPDILMATAATGLSVRPDVSLYLPLTAPR